MVCGISSHLSKAFWVNQMKKLLTGMMVILTILVGSSASAFNKHTHPMLYVVNNTWAGPTSDFSVNGEHFALAPAGYKNKFVWHEGDHMDVIVETNDAARTSATFLIEDMKIGNTYTIELKGTWFKTYIDYYENGVLKSSI